MADKFALLLILVTVVSGIIWTLDRVVLAPARRKKVAELKSQINDTVDNATLENAMKKPGWVDTFGSIFPVILVVLVIRSFVYEPFQIPSGSMMPTLLIGDFIAVEKFAYGVKNPITHNTLIETGHPKRGDIAVFRYPKDPSVYYIKRVIGLPGDVVVYNTITKNVTINPKNSDSSLNTMVSYSAKNSSQWVQTFASSGIYGVKDGFFNVDLNEEELPGSIRLNGRNETIDGIKHAVIEVPNAQDRSEYYFQQIGQIPGRWVVPEGHYFMMGDNRDNSGDSRYWGFVPEKNLVGKATGIWMSFEKQQGEWPTGVRLNRIGGIH